MDNVIVVSGVTIDELVLDAAGSGPGCYTARIDPVIEEVKLNDCKLCEATALKNLRVKIICPGLSGAIQKTCEAATLLKKNSIKSSVTGETPLVVGDTLLAGLCTGSYLAGNCRTACVCVFHVKIKHAKRRL